jgi:hypothetical protein
MIQIFLSEHVGKQSNKICHIKLEGMSGMGIHILKNSVEHEFKI